MKISDIAPEEAHVVALAERLSEALSAPQAASLQPLNLDASFLEAARELLATLSQPANQGYHGSVELTEQQIRSHLEFSPDFIEPAKEMLLDFIQQTESKRSQE